MEIQNKIGVITGAGSGIGEAVALELAKRGVRGLALVDQNQAVQKVSSAINDWRREAFSQAFVGDVTDSEFRRQVYISTVERYGIPHICVPAAGITRDALAVKIDKSSGKANIYPLELFRLVTEVDLIAPIYWALEMVGHVAEDRTARGLGQWKPEEHIQGTVIFIGSISSLGNKGQIAYAAAKAGLEGAAATFMAESIFHGVRCGVIHPGFTDTPMVRSMGEEAIQKRVLPNTQLKRLIRPEEIADAICFMISNSAVSGQLWADAGWHPSA
jgi:3-oxoacyl-[acyl-carrier protein] reductase